jgi:phage-related protein
LRASRGGRTAPTGAEKRIEWRGSSLSDIRGFPEDARRDAGRQLHLLQQGEESVDWKPMSAVGPGTIEIRVRDGGEHRVIVVSKFVEAIYVLHAFVKKSQRTSRRDLRLSKQRYRDLVAERQVR